MMRNAWPICLALLLIFGTSAQAGTAPVSVKQQSVKVKHHTFNPARPPAAMPKLTPPESGVCHFEFGADTGIGCDVEMIDPRTAEVQITDVDTILTLDIDIWTKIGAPKKLIAHEEGHRTICELYYKNASAIARRLGSAMIGRKAQGTGRNKAEAVQSAQQKLLTELDLAYMNETRMRCSACQVIYDKITNHSLIPIDESIAIEQAVTQETAAFNRQRKAAAVGGGATAIRVASRSWRTAGLAGPAFSSQFQSAPPTFRRCGSAAAPPGAHSS